VVEAESGEEGLEIIKRDKVDLILLYVAMPGMNGWEVCMRIKADEKLKQITGGYVYCLWKRRGYNAQP
jgi:CheY-like chemotaxis protein